MLDHRSTNAVAIQLFYDDELLIEKRKLYIAMTKLAIKSIKDHSDYDIVIITNRDVDFDAIIEKREFFDYPAYHTWQSKGWRLTRFDMQKIYYWSLYKYERVIALDNDIVATSNLNEIFENEYWRNFKLVAQAGTHGHLNSGILLLRPSIVTFEEMFDIVKTANFSPETGWNNCGDIGLADWSHQAANGAQGFLGYYFYPNGELLFNNFARWFNHYAGQKKHSPEYQKMLREYL